MAKTRQRRELEQANPNGEGPLIESVPPHSLEDEQATIGSCLLSGVAFVVAKEFITTSQAFYRRAHQYAWEAMLEIAGRGDPIDAISVLDHLRGRGVIASETDAEYLFSLANHVPTAAHVDYYARRVRDLYLQRRVASVAHGLSIDATKLGANLDDLLETAGHEFVAIHEERDSGEILTFSQIGDQLEQEIADRELGRGTTLGWETGIVPLDYYLGTIGPGHLFLVSARTGVGKTFLMQQISTHIAKMGIAGCIFSLEMRATKIYLREWQRASGVPTRTLAAGNLDAEQEERAEASLVKFKQLPIHVCTGVRNISEIESRIADGVRRHGWQWIVIDYIELCRVPSVRANDGRRVEIDTIGQDLKFYAEKYSVLMIAAQQLNRQGQLREADGPGNAADHILIIDENHNLKLDKNRDGPTGVVKTKFDPERVTYVPISTRDDEGSPQQASGEEVGAARDTWWNK